MLGSDKIEGALKRTLFLIKFLKMTFQLDLLAYEADFLYLGNLPV
ncbi:hypothetical protein SGODD07_01656 [Streptococcus gordonii]|uniref:Uncharacterized protein n=1 Tax=Streptococcus gordonii TaxID=1302 RepID=A0A139N2D1_STRGN|nr:hypothetical protein SGODD07_01656 [Streptococcus gordonii]